MLCGCSKMDSPRQRRRSELEKLHHPLTQEEPPGHNNDTLKCDESYPQCCALLSGQLPDLSTDAVDVNMNNTSTMTEDHCLDPSNTPVVWNGGFPPNMYQPYRGQLKLAVYVNHGLLTVHVMQARHLSSRKREFCHGYVKLALVPDAGRRTKCKTATQPDTNNPVFDEKFSFELLPWDSRKRLLISLYHRENTSRRRELIGCMSFSVKKIIDRRTVVNGWYFLLCEIVGQRKHLKANSNRRHLVELHDLGREEDAPSLDLCTFEIERGEHGFGFTLSGGNPVQICSVQTGSPAAMVGLRAGDSIAQVNGHDVRRCSGEIVARIVRLGEGCLKIHIERPKPPKKLVGGAWNPGYSTVTSSCESTDTGFLSSHSGRTRSHPRPRFTGDSWG